jgi:cytochrome P450
LQPVRLQLTQAFAGAEPDNFDALAKECRFLNAVINESLRLWPPVASGLQRVTPAEGLTLSVAGKQLVVPGDVIVTTPTFLMQRDPRNFAPHPEAFRPERWLAPEHEENFNLKAFNPFSYGPESCIGRHLAFMEVCEHRSRPQTTLTRCC